MEDKFKEMNFNGLWNLWKKIKNDSNSKRYLVINEPEKAKRLYEKYEDKELGEIFVEKYKEDPIYYDDVYFISVKLNQPIKRRNKSELFKKIEDEENRL